MRLTALLLAAALCVSLAACTGGTGSAAPSTRTSAARPSSTSTAPVADWVRTENEKPGTSAWRLTGSTTADDQQLAGYASAGSVAPGGSFGVYAESRLGPVTVTAYRLGWYHGTGARQVWRSTPITPARQPACTTGSLRMVSCDWRRTTTVSAVGWPAGSYLLELTAGGKGHYIPITVRSVDLVNRLVLVSETATYQAYNQWGGYSLYKGPDGSFGDRANQVSYDRPYDGNGAVKLLAFEIGPVGRAEKLGLPLAYTTSLDVDQHPASLRGALGVVSLGHDEYWTTRMRQAFTDARDTGTNIAFLGANALYWRVRFADHGRVMVGYKSAVLDPLRNSPSTTTQWRQAPHPDPENSMTGMLYECFPGIGPFVVKDPSFFLFRGTHVRAGSSFSGLAGVEIDRAYPIAGTPENLQVVAHSPQRCGPYLNTFSDMTYYTVPSGAGVLDTGSMLWTIAVRGTSSQHGSTSSSVAFARAVTDNLLLAMAAGPMGRTHPAAPNLASLHASASTASGTGGRVATH